MTEQEMHPQNLESPAAVDLSGAGCLGDLAQLEGYSSQAYALGLADAIRFKRVPLNNQRERLQALAGLGAEADQAAAETLTQHHQVLEALCQRFAFEAAQWVGSDKRGAAEVAERYLAAAVRAQAACVRVLSALKALRDAPSSGPGTPTTIEAAFGAKHKAM